MSYWMKAAHGNSTRVAIFHLLGFSGSPLLELLFFLCCLTAYTLTLVGNGLIVFLTLSSPALQTPMYFFLRNLSFMELCYSSITMPRILTNYVTGNNKISFIGCAVQMYFFLLLGCAECYILGVMAYDRYVAVCYPLRYMTIMDKYSCALLVVGSWMSGLPVSSVQTTLTFSSPFCGPNEINHFFCDIPPVLRLVCADTSQIEIAMLIITVIIIISPFMLILISYARIIVAVVRMSSSESRQKAVSTCSSHLLVVTLFYGSAMTVYLFPQSNDKLLSIFYTMVTPMVNPIIYSLRNKEVKAALWKTVGLST
ncbi:olfactory receptor 10A7-like [Sphaerodactylus townsendi]|uniref:olfactory receptor 10A7-like n=1 Tax=Sphaerodactylus townsendi TaxID=933632 RepID=UPI0020269ABC|nr:olfactory receptor 10A7-like [Sphaerodactylus townsendi]XP_048372635.1 olfactory receptor 10A7-like [Sphaerodactylus townsendi]